MAVYHSRNAFARGPRHRIVRRRFRDIFRHTIYVGLGGE